MSEEESKGAKGMGLPLTVRISCNSSGGSREGAWGAWAPLICSQKWGPKGRKKIVLRPAPPLSQGLDDRPPPPYLKVWIHHWIRHYFALWCHFTNMTRILEGFAFLCKWALLLFRPCRDSKYIPHILKNSWLEPSWGFFGAPLALSQVFLF